MPSYSPVHLILGIMVAGCALMLLGLAYSLL